MERSAQTIQLMDDALASQVAAGEVVERPASVIKELVENAIDAGASTIRVEIQRGGTLLIRVTDDGCGMSRQDAQMSLLRHATSKLHSFEDLYNIQQMGFRGEAIPSIASISHFSILTRREGDVEGTLLKVDGGKAQEPQSAGCARGTCIEVRELFYNIPVRRKFLKSPETEESHIQHQVILHALCYPHIRFVLTMDGGNDIDTAATKDLRQRIADLKGRDLAQKLILMNEGEAPGVSVGGYLMPLAEAKRNRKMQYIFLNGRPIEDKIILRAVKDGYGGLPTGLHPALFLYLQVDPGLVDINVHPAKKEVRFRRIADVCTAIMDAIAGTLRSYAKQQQAEREALQQQHSPQRPSTSHGSTPTPAPSASQSQSTTPSPSRKPALSLKALTDHQVPKQQQLPLPQMPPAPAPHPIEAKKVHYPIPDDSRQARSTELSYPPLIGRALQGPPGFVHLGTLHGQYALFENKEGLVLLHPRAARERLIFERLMRSNQTCLATQQLLIPVLLEMDVRDLAQVNELEPQLERAGFRISHFGQRTLRVESIPALLPMEEVEKFMYQLLELFSSRGEFKLSRSPNPYELFAIQLAKQYAQTEDTRIFLESPDLLLNDLLCCQVPYCTPTGKPTIVPISVNEIKRKFHSY